MSDLHKRITAQFIEALSRDVAPWSPDWLVSPAAMPLRANGTPYRGVNHLCLSLTAQFRSFANPRWLTFKQALNAGGAVRKGERGATVIFYQSRSADTAQTDADGDDGEASTGRGAVLRAYTVFNADQCDGLGVEFAPPPPVQSAFDMGERDHVTESLLLACGATVHNDGGQRAFYNIGSDSIHLPAFSSFKSVDGYLATLAHELVHWTGHQSRLDRFVKLNSDRHAVAREELVAEIGAAFICSSLGVAGGHFESHAAYVKHWIALLQNDERAIFRAAAQAQCAADVILKP